jgi:hypothetical protein
LCLLLSSLLHFWFYWFEFFLSSFSQVCQGSVNFVYFFKEPAFCLLILCMFFFCFYFINFSPYFYYFSLSACFGFACSCFSRCLRYSIRSLIWDLSVLLIYALMAINFPLRTALDVSHRFW